MTRTTMEDSTMQGRDAKGRAARYAGWGLKGLLTLAFAAAGLAKLAGAAMMVGTFEAIGWGQWFRYLTGAIEVAAAALLWVPGAQAPAGLVLVATMIGAVIAHLAVLGPSAVPALVLGLLSAAAVWLHREQLVRG